MREVEAHSGERVNRHLLYVHALTCAGCHVTILMLASGGTEPIAHHMQTSCRNCGVDNWLDAGIYALTRIIGFPREMRKLDQEYKRLEGFRENDDEDESIEWNNPQS